MKNDGVPVEASVAATLRPMWPDLPMPDTTTRPVQPRIIWTALVKRGRQSVSQRENGVGFDLEGVAGELECSFRIEEMAIMATKYTNECDGDRPGFLATGSRRPPLPCFPG